VYLTNQLRVSFVPVIKPTSLHWYVLPVDHPALAQPERDEALVEDGTERR
jgi:hypothetical protein